MMTQWDLAYMTHRWFLILLTMLEKHYKPNLSKPVSELVGEDGSLIITDSSLSAGSLELKIKFT